MGARPAEPAVSRVKLTNPDKVLYPATGTTKADVFAYYTGIAEVILPHIAGRPATRKRWPNGVDGKSFFEKQLAASAPEWLPRAALQHRSGPTTYPIIDSRAGLAWIAQQAALELHVPQWRFVTSGAGGLKPGPATRLVFDLDPGEDVTLPRLAEVARAIRDLVDGIGLATFPVTSGSKGLHLYSPLDKPVRSQGAAVLAKRIAQQLESSMPELVTAVMKKSARAGKVFVDWSQNNPAKTTVAPYSLRGREHPTVAAPRTWEELDDPDIRQLRYDEVLARVARDGDLLAPLDHPVRERNRSTSQTQKRTGPSFEALYPMLPTPGSVSELDSAAWAFEGKWDGYRLLVDADHGAVRLRSRSGCNVTAEHPRLRSLAADLADHHVVLDGEVVALDESGVPRFAEMQNSAHAGRVEFWAFDLLYLDGRSLLRASYRDRRRLLETLSDGTGLVVPELLAGDGARALERSRECGWEGVVAKKWASTYRPGHRSAAWVKQKHWKTQEVLIVGWRAGEGGRGGGVGSLLMGIPAGGKLRFVGRVGSGFTELDLARLKKLLAPLRVDESPFDAPLSKPDAQHAAFVRPTLVAEVRYSEQTADGRLRQPSWRGLRPDKTASDVTREE
ncbi:MAG TPA: non-homologous end-joining DNA ligase [Mycobacterium sp.]|nr:non-homologous end-joining DNA ligase [Mycobacterium sp.]